MFAEWLTAIDFDTVTLEVLIPCLHTEMKLNLLLPGLTEFVSSKLLN